MNTNYSYPATKTVSVLDVYGKQLSALLIPEGYEAVEFRPPNHGEHQLGYITFGPTITNSNFSQSEPRIILRKVEKPVVIPADTQPEGETVGSVYGGPVTIPQGWKYVAFRKLSVGDYFIGVTTKGIDFTDIAALNKYTRIIIERV